MKANFFTESVLYWLAKGVSKAAQKLPAEWNVRLGAAAGTAFYHLLPGRRATALDNLRAAFGSSHSEQEYQSILRSLFQNIGMTFMEVAAIPRIDRAYVDRWITIAPSCRERLEQALAQGKGVLFVAAHFGNWELITVTGALHGYPTLVLARQQGWSKLNQLLTEYRESKGCRVVTKGFPVRELIEGLRQRRIVGILADQDGGRNGVLAYFFNRLASTAPGIIALSLNTQAPILPVFMVRTHGPAHTLVVEEPLPVPAEGTVEERLRAGVQLYLSLLEKYIRRYPSQWLWLHRRWKSCPQRRLLVFSDGKAGHLAQSRALAQCFRKAWDLREADDKRLEGILAPPLVSGVTVAVRFRHPAWRHILSFVASVVPKRFHGGDRWLRWALDPACYQQLRSEHAHVSISCGASVAAVNLLWAWQIRCKPVHILRAGFPSWRRFDLSVQPRHDLRAWASGGASASASHRAWASGGASASASQGARHVPRRVLAVDGALVTGLQPEPEQVRAWGKLLKLSGKRKIGVLLGGPAKGVDLGKSEVEPAIESLLAAAERMDAQLLVTSSRRTPADVEEWLAGRLSRHPRCRLLVLVNRGQAGALRTTEEAPSCILSLSDALVVSGDSISMVSEAVASGKPVLGLPPRPVSERRAQSKYHHFLRQMDQRGKIRLVDGPHVGQVLGDILCQKGSGTFVQGGQEASTKVPDPVEFLRGWL